MVLNVTIGVITFSLTTVLSLVLWLLKRRKAFKKLYMAITGEKIDVIFDKKTFKLKYAFYKKLIKLLIKNIKDKYLVDVFKLGDVDYEKIVKEILDFIGGDGNKSESDGVAT